MKKSTAIRTAASAGLVMGAALGGCSSHHMNSQPVETPKPPVATVNDEKAIAERVGSCSILSVVDLHKLTTEFPFSADGHHDTVQVTVAATLTRAAQQAMQRDKDPITSNLQWGPIGIDETQSVLPTPNGWKLSYAGMAPDDDRVTINNNQAIFDIYPRTFGPDTESGIEKMDNIDVVGHTYTELSLTASALFGNFADADNSEDTYEIPCGMVAYVDNGGTDEWTKASAQPVFSPILEQYNQNKPPSQPNLGYRLVGDPLN